MQIEAIELVYNGISIKKLLSHLASDPALSKARDGNFYLTRGYSARSNPNGSGFTKSD